MARIDTIIDQRRRHAAYDERLWALMDKVAGRNLINLTDTGLQDRLAAIDRNIQYLDNGSTPRDSLGPERGWLSPWWWLRARYWTLLEFDHRGIIPSATPEIPPMQPLVPGMNGVVNGGQRMLVRISKKDWLMDTLNNGTLRFAPASLYSDPALDSARGDDELRKTYRRPGQVVQITGLGGQKMDAIGDVAFSARRANEQCTRIIDMPYWLCSFSSDLDPRLFNEFGSPDPTEDACIIIFEPEIFVQRAISPLNNVAPSANKSLFPTDYFDPYHPPPSMLSVLRSKEFRYAYQREMRFVLDPESGPLVWSGDPVFVKIGSIADIAGIYDRSGRKLAGTGPGNFLA